MRVFFLTVFCLKDVVVADLSGMPLWYALRVCNKRVQIYSVFVNFWSLKID